MKLVAMLRVKNAKLTIDQCLRRLSSLCDEIVIVDNGSTDGTLAVYKRYPKVVAIKKTKGFNEGRDKIMAHRLAKTRDPDWILWIDADEVFEKSLTRSHLESYMKQSELGAVYFRLYHFWQDKYHFRLDGPWFRYTTFPQRPMWRNQSNARFRNLKFHNGSIMGVQGKSTTSKFRLKHYGYLHQKQRLQKQATYAKLKTNPMTVKTMPLSAKHQINLPFIEVSHTDIQHVWLSSEKLLWDTIQTFFYLCDSLFT